jgi:group I intron endonuclease
MKLFYRTHSEKAGIYKITNTKNGRIYIGSTSSFTKRGTAHKHTLEAKTHTNTFLQNDFNLCGSECFIFEIVEVVAGTKEERLTREQFYIDQFFDEQKQCYNLAKNAFDNRSGTKNINPADRTNDNRCRSPTPEVLEKRVEAIKAVYVDNPALKEVSRVNANKRWDANDYPEYHLRCIATGEEITVKSSLRAWCESRKLNYKAFHLLVKGKSKTSGGWELVRP